MTEIANSSLLRSERTSNKSYDHRILTVAGLLFIAAIIALVAPFDSSGASATDLSMMTVYP
jgi:hypothetical protein